MKAIRTANAKKKTGLGLNTCQTKHDANDHVHSRVCVRKARIVCKEKFNFAESFDELSGKRAFEMRHYFVSLFLFVGISEFLYANFSSTCVRCTHLLKSWRDRWARLQGEFEIDHTL